MQKEKNVLYFRQDEDRSFARWIHLSYEIGHVTSFRIDGAVLYAENDRVRITHVLLAHLFDCLTSVIRHVNGYCLSQEKNFKTL